jgi:phosphate transport system substrate-binding protein
MKKTKVMMALTLSMAMAASLAACGGSGSTSTTAAATTAAAADTKAADTKAADSKAADTKAADKNLSGSVSTNGSTSMEKVVGNVMEQFMEDNPGVKVTYDPTGSGTGIEQAANGACDIGLASRDLKDEETAKGLEQTTVALDGIAIIVNANSPIEDLKIDDITKIYTGETTNWKDLGGSDAEIAAIGREAGSGTRDGFETITGTKDKCKLSQELTSTGAVIEAVKNSPNAIGYASFSDAEGKDGIRILKVEGVECNEENISNGTYKIQRDFNLITKKDAQLSDAAQAFYDFFTSADAADLISSAGVVPTAGK